MKTLAIILAILLISGLGACSDMVNPSSADTDKTVVNEVAKLEIKTATGRYGITLNLTLTSLIDDLLIPAVGDDKRCLRVKVLEHYTDAAVNWAYSDYDFRELFGTSELQAGFHYSANINIDNRYLNPDADYGKITVIIYLKREHQPDMIYSFDTDVDYDFRK